MSEELLYCTSAYKRRFPKPIGHYTLLFTSLRIIVAKTLPSWIELSPLYAKGASYFLMRKSIKQRQETIKKLPFDEISEIDKENFEIPYSDIKEAKLFRKLTELKLSIKLNKTEHVYNLVSKETELKENFIPILHSVLGERVIDTLVKPNKGKAHDA